MHRSIPKYVEKSRQSADASNLENIVKGFKVAAADTDYNIIPNGKDTTATFKILMKADGTTITPDNKVPTDGKKWSDALKEYTGYDFSTKQEDIKLKSKKWKLEKDNRWKQKAILRLVLLYLLNQMVL